MPLECQKDLFGTFHTVGVGREGAWGLCPKRELGVCQLRLPMFIMLVIFLDILLVVSILNIVYDCHLWPLLHFCPEGVVNNFCGIYGYIFAWELPFLVCVCVCASVKGEMQGLVGCVQSWELGALHLPSDIYPVGKLQSNFTCGFHFGHGLWLPFVTAFAVLKEFSWYQNLYVSLQKFEKFEP